MGHRHCPSSITNSNVCLVAGVTYLIQKEVSITIRRANQNTAFSCAGADHLPIHILVHRGCGLVCFAFRMSVATKIYSKTPLYAIPPHLSAAAVINPG